MKDEHIRRAIHDDAYAQGWNDCLVSKAGGMLQRKMGSGDIKGEIVLFVAGVLIGVVCAISVYMVVRVG
jgi:hypothetical protein